MLTGVHVAFIGGDARQLEVIERFAELDAIVTLIGFDNLEHSFNGVHKAELNEENLADADALILPAVMIHESGKIDTLFSSKEMALSPDLLAALQPHTKLYTGFAKPFLKNMCREANVELVEIFERDDVAIYNSIPTAEGAVMMAMEHTDFTIHGCTAMVLGMGRTGMTLARTLQGLGAKVKVGLRREAHFARAAEMGLQAFYVHHLADQAKDVDLLFNTIPTMIVTAKIIAGMPHRCVIIDLASKPGGTDFRFAEKRGIKALLAPGLPGIVAPKTAGQIIANCIIQLITEDSENWGKTP